MNKTKFVSIVVSIVAIGAGVFLFIGKSVNTPTSPQVTGAADPRNATYTIEGKTVTLVDGVSEVEVAPGSASKIMTRYFGNEAKGDFDGDGREDVAFLLTQSTGGTGTFYYVVAALNTPAGYIGSEGLLLGDRIAPQTTEISRNPSHENIIVVNYADRKQGESFATKPSVGKSIWLKLDPKTREFGEVVQNFEGEADPSRMTLTMKTWKWIRASYNNDKIVTPRKGDAFTITFGKDGRFSATTDCNSIGGLYTTNKQKISFKEVMSTMMYCEGSQEADFSKILNETQSYHFTSKGELVFDLKFDSGSIVFK